MKLLHVSDWHLGRATYGASRAADQDAVLDEIADHAKHFGPDLILHTGDLFDSVRPAYEDLHRALDALERLADIAPVVVLRGNHDSAALFSVFTRLLAKRSRITFVDRARRPKDGGVLHFDSRAGHRVRLASLPFVHANRMVDAFEDATRWTSEYAKRIHIIAEALGKGLKADLDPSRDVLLFAAHLHVAGATWSGSERPIHIGDHYASKVERLPAISYAAFGHIHKPQELPGETVTGAYAGSALQLDFGEVGEQKSIIAVEAEPSRPPTVTRIPLHRGRKLYSFSGTLDQLDDVIDEIGAAICKLTIDTETPASDLSDSVRERLPNAEIVQVIERCAERRAVALDEREGGKSGKGGKGDGDDEVREPTLDELLGEYLAAKGTERAPVVEVLETFRTVLAAIEAEEAPSFDAEDVFDAAAIVVPTTLAELGDGAEGVEGGGDSAG